MDGLDYVRDHKWGVLGFFMVLFYVVVALYGSVSPALMEGVPIYDVGDTVSTSLTVSSVKGFDDGWSDGYVCSLSYRYALVRDDVTVLSSEITPLTSNTITVPLSYLASEPGHYVFGVIVYSGESWFSEGVWSSYVYSEAGSGTYAFQVRDPNIPTEPPEPASWIDSLLDFDGFIAKLQTLINSIIDWLT